MSGLKRSKWTPIPHRTSSAAAAAKSLQSCQILRDPMDCSLPGSSVHGIFQARVLDWVAIAFSEPALSSTYQEVQLCKVKESERWTTRGACRGTALIEDNCMVQGHRAPKGNTACSSHPHITSWGLRPGLQGKVQDFFHVKILKISEIPNVTAESVLYQGPHHSCFLWALGGMLFWALTVISLPDLS